MNGCDEVRDGLSAYLDGELTSRRREAVEAHLAGCEACRQELASLRQVSACLQAWQAPEMRPELSAVFAERLAAKTRQPEGRRWFAGAGPRAAWAAGLAACLVLGIFAILQQKTPYQPPVRPTYSADTGGRRNVIAKGNRAGVPVTPTTSATEARPNKAGSPTPPIVIHQRPLHIRIPKEPAPVMGKATDEAPVVDPTMTAVNVLNETSTINGAMVALADSYPLGETLEFAETMSKTAVTDEMLPPIEVSYENQPEALAFALITEAP